MASTPHHTTLHHSLACSPHEKSNQIESNQKGKKLNSHPRPYMRNLPPPESRSRSPSASVSPCGHGTDERPSPSGFAFINAAALSPRDGSSLTPLPRAAGWFGRPPPSVLSCRAAAFTAHPPPPSRSLVTVGTGERPRRDQPLPCHWRHRIVSRCPPKDRVVALRGRSRTTPTWPRACVSRQRTLGAGAELVRVCRRGNATADGCSGSASRSRTKGTTTRHGFLLDPGSPGTIL